MLHREAVASATYDLLLALMELEELSDFTLVGGTSIALRHGYRESDDLDLFSAREFDATGLKDVLLARLPGCSVTGIARSSLTAHIAGIKVDILRHAYPRLEATETIDGVRLMSLRDISAMKINAVSGRGSKKDFSDLLFLHEHGLPLSSSMDNYLAKYGDDALFPALKSLTYFGDTDGEPDPRYRNGWEWEEVRGKMERLGSDLQHGFGGMGS